MELEPVLARVESALAAQVGLSNDLEQAANALLTVLEPVMRQAFWDVAQQAAAEVSAQLVDSYVEVTMLEGEPVLKVRRRDVDPGVEEDFDARITLRLPPSLKELVESVAQQSGESINGWVVKTLAGLVKRSGEARRVSGSFEI